MGLDQMLYANIHVGGQYDHNEAEGEVTFTVNSYKESKKITIPAKKIDRIVIEAAYWRKANQIHKWFVENVQDGVDDCGSYYVSREQLAELVDICKQIINKEEEPSKLLSTQEGFFFGGYDYGEGYMYDIESTIKMLEEALNDPLLESAYFEYHSSW